MTSHVKSLLDNIHIHHVQLTVHFNSTTDCIVFEACRVLLLGRATPASTTIYISDQLVTNEFVCMLLTLLNTFQKTLRAENFVLAVGGRPRFPKEVSFNPLLPKGSPFDE